MKPVYELQHRYFFSKRWWLHSGYLMRVHAVERAVELSIQFPWERYRVVEVPQRSTVCRCRSLLADLGIGPRWWRHCKRERRYGL